MALLIIRDLLRGKLRLSQPFKRGKSLRPLGAWTRIIAWRSSQPSAASIRKTPRCLASPQILGSGRLQPLRAAHLPPLQPNNTSRAGGTSLGLGQWKGEKEGISFGGARRMNAAAQTAGQLADDRKPSTALDGFSCRPIVRDPALYDVACKHQLHSQFWMPIVELCMSCHIGQ